MVSSEDFSFPKISYSLPKFAVSPSLWRVCSHPVFPREDCCEGIQASDDDDGEEKMDMLWEEYFIQELKRVSSSIDHHIVKKEAAAKAEAAKSSDSVVCDCIQQGSTNSRSTTYTACGNSNSSWVVFIKVFKKIFFINNNLAWI